MDIHESTNDHSPRDYSAVRDGGAGLIDLARAGVYW